jgi:hypothetical protein
LYDLIVSGRFQGLSNPQLQVDVRVLEQLMRDIHVAVNTPST